jgi:hypothetical protein
MVVTSLGVLQMKYPSHPINGALGHFIVRGGKWLIVYSLIVVGLYYKGSAHLAESYCPVAMRWLAMLLWDWLL